MNIKNTDFNDLYIIENFNSNDIRGNFNKLYNKNEYDSKINNFEIKEVYCTTSQKNVIRGMHFQKPPYDVDKIVSVIKGSAIDVVIDLRKESKTYGKVFQYELNKDKKESIFIPKGFAHGFKAMEDDTMMLYLVSNEYNKECDTGIKWNSIPYEWNIKKPIISSRDSEFIEFKNFKSPF